MFVTVLGRLYESMNNMTLAQAEEASFNDVALDSYYAAAVKWASENGIVQGYGNGEFRPDEPITREQIVVIIYRFAKYAGLDTSSISDLLGYQDNNDISDWALEAMKWAVGKGIISGRDDGTIDPQGLATRAEVAAIIHRYHLVTTNN